jgi:hypothetical protein
LVRINQLGEQLLDAPADVIADWPDGGQVKGRRIREVPVERALAG